MTDPTALLAGPLGGPSGALTVGPALAAGGSSTARRPAHHFPRRSPTAGRRQCVLRLRSQVSSGREVTPVHTDCRRLGIKGSQVQILSSRHGPRSVHYGLDMCRCGVHHAARVLTVAGDVCESEAQFDRARGCPRLRKPGTAPSTTTLRRCTTVLPNGLSRSGNGSLTA